MSNSIKIILITAIALLIGGAITIAFSIPAFNKKLVQQRTAHETEIRIIQDSLAARQKRQDVLRSQIDSLSKRLVQQDKNLKYIIRKYDRKKDSVINLNADASIQFLSEYLSKKNSSR